MANSVVPIPNPPVANAIMAMVDPQLRRRSVPCARCADDTVELRAKEGMEVLGDLERRGQLVQQRTGGFVPASYYRPRRRLGRVDRNNASMKQIVGAALLDSLEYPRQLLVARRSAPEHLAGMWEFPGGKVEPGEECIPALARELMEELGIGIRVGQEIPGPHEQGWPLNERAAMRVWFAGTVSGQPEPLEDHDRLLWVDLDQRDEINELPWIPADYPIVAELFAVLDKARAQA